MGERGNVHLEAGDALLALPVASNTNMACCFSRVPCPQQEQSKRKTESPQYSEAQGWK